WVATIPAPMAKTATAQDKYSDKIHKYNSFFDNSIQSILSIPLLYKKHKPSYLCKINHICTYTKKFCYHRGRLIPLPHSICSN
ncbi:MAG TPA: hypothetical protein PLT82_13155, partial [Candidatus Hydrogenedens sp.]|nr:hypothetical protein [Candidatus Hydrogenedens sp.]HPP60071.1 hypothetical protein [Candidatus Hydrogenedens sp.]